MRFLRGLLIIALAFGFLPAAAYAAETKAKFPNPVIALIDMQRVLDELLAAKGAQKQLEAQRSKFQKQTEKEENDLREAEQDLSKSRDQLSADVYEDREQHLRQRFLTEESHVLARRKVLDKGFTDSMNEVRTALLSIVEEVARSHGINLVLIKQQALWADKGFDMTDEVLDQLNKKLPQVSFRLAPEEEQ